MAEKQDNRRPAVEKPTRFRIRRPWFDGTSRHRPGDVVVLPAGLRPAQDWVEVSDPATQPKEPASKDMKAMSEASSPRRKRPKMPGI